MASYFFVMGKDWNFLIKNGYLYRIIFRVTQGIDLRVTQK